MSLFVSGMEQGRMKSSVKLRGKVMKNNEKKQFQVKVIVNSSFSEAVDFNL